MFVYARVPESQAPKHHGFFWKLSCLRVNISENTEPNQKRLKNLLTNFLWSFQIRKYPTSDIDTLNFIQFVRRNICRGINISKVINRRKLLKMLVIIGLCSFKYTISVCNWYEKISRWRTGWSSSAPPAPYAPERLFPILLSCTSYQSFKKFGARVGQREIFKTWIFSHFVSSNAISLHDFKLILCMLGRLHKLQYKIRKPIPKSPKRVSITVHERLFTKLLTCMQCLFTNIINLQRALLCWRLSWFVNKHLT